MLTVPSTWSRIPTLSAHRPKWAATASTAYGVAGTTDLPLAGTAPGTLVKDASQWPRTRLDLTVPEAQLNPHALDAPLMPWATTVRLTFGYVDPLTATPYSVLVATVRLMETTAERPGGLLDLTCADRSSLTDGAMQAADVTYPGGTTVANAIIAAAALDGLGAPVVVNGLTAGQAAVAVPAGWKWNGSPWQAIEDLADLIGAEVFYDAAERLVLRTPPVPSSTIAFTFDTGTGGTLTGMKSTVSRAPNAVALVYDRSNVSGPVIGTWTDARVGSPSIVPGPYGIRRLVEERTGRPTLAQANAAATAYATRVAGRVRTVEYRTVPVPWLEPGDTVTVEPVDAGPAESMVIQAVTLPLGHDVMTYTTRNSSYFGPI